MRVSLHVVTALGLMFASTAAFSVCVRPVPAGVDSLSYSLQNICDHAINIKYTFSDSRPLSGAYTTLQPQQKTFDQATQSETARYYECPFPGVPQTITGGCAGGKNLRGSYGERAGIKSIEDPGKAQVEREKLELSRAETERQRQEAEIAQLVSQAESSGELQPAMVPVPPIDTAALINAMRIQPRQSSGSGALGFKTDAPTCKMSREILGRETPGCRR